MTTYNTGNPIGSTAVKDLYDNAENLDTAVNDTSRDTWSDRLGRSRKTMSGMERQFDAAEDYREATFASTQADKQSRFNDFIASSGYQFLGDYAAGIEIAEYNQIVRDADGEFWRLSGEVELPYTTTGAGLPEGGAFVSVGDALLRQELASSEGANSVGYEQSSVGQVLGGVLEKQSILMDRPFTPATGRVLQTKVAYSSDSYSSSSETFENASNALTVSATSQTSTLVVIATAHFDVMSSNDNTAFSLVELAAYDEVNFNRVGTACRIGSGILGLGTPTAVTIPGTAAFCVELSSDDRRYDRVSDNENGSWTVRLRAAGSSGGRWQSSAASFVALEVGTDFSTTLNENVSTVSHVPVYGQSLSVGATNAPSLTSSALRPGRAVMFNSGPRTLRTSHSGGYENTQLSDDATRYIRDLFEIDSGSSGETPCSGLAYELTRGNGLADDEALLMACHGIGGMSYSRLKKGTVPYSNMIKGIRRARLIAATNNKFHRTLAVSMVHGEADRNAGPGIYKSYMEELQADLTNDIRRIDGRSGEVMLILDQISNWTNYGLEESNVPFDQLNAALENPGKIYCVGPKYMLETTDGTHLTANSTAWLGAYHGQIIRRIEVLGEEWKPLHATSAVRDGDEVLLTFHMPVGAWANLTFDTTLVSNPGDYGLRWIDDGDGNAVTVTGAAITGSNQIMVKLSSIPTGSNPKIGIADMGTPGTSGGPTTGPRSNIRDQSTFTDYYGNPLHNWACHQRINVV